jgi:fasciclin 1
VIDDILVPLSNGNRSSNEIYNPDALSFLTNANSFDIGSHRVRSFYQRVVVNKKESLFQADGFHTFFIPVEEGFKVSRGKVLFPQHHLMTALITLPDIASTPP